MCVGGRRGLRQNDRCFENIRGRVVGCCAHIGQFAQIDQVVPTQNMYNYTSNFSNESQHTNYTPGNFIVGNVTNRLSGGNRYR